MCMCRPALCTLHCRGRCVADQAVCAAAMLATPQVQVQANSANGREKVVLEARAGKAKQKMEAAKEKADSVEKAPMPKIEVCLGVWARQGAAACAALL